MTRFSNRSELIIIIVGYSSLYYLKNLYSNNINGCKDSNTLDRENIADDKLSLSKVNE